MKNDPKDPRSVELAKSLQGMIEVKHCYDIAVLPYEQALDLAIRLIGAEAARARGLLEQTEAG